MTQLDASALNVPLGSMVGAFDTVDMDPGRVADKFELSGLTRGAVTDVDFFGMTAGSGEHRWGDELATPGGPSGRSDIKY